MDCMDGFGHMLCLDQKHVRICMDRCMGVWVYGCMYWRRLCFDQKYVRNEYLFLPMLCCFAHTLIHLPSLSSEIILVSRTPCKWRGLSNPSLPAWESSINHETLEMEVSEHNTMPLPAALCLVPMSTCSCGMPA